MSTTTATTTKTVQIAVKAPPEQIWAALTDGAITPAYYMGLRPSSSSSRAGPTGTPPTGRRRSPARSKPSSPGTR